MPIQQKEAYASMWINLSPSKQENIIKAAISKVDEFNPICFDSEIFYDELNSKPYNSITPLERMFKLILSLNSTKSLEKNEFKSYYFEKILETKKTIGNSNFIWSSIACNIKDAFTLEHFFMNLMIQQLDLLYFKTYVINELDIEHADDKKKNKKKKHKKKKVKESGCCEKHPEFNTDSDPNVKANDDPEHLGYKRIDTTNDDINQETKDKIEDNLLIEKLTENKSSPILTEEINFENLETEVKDPGMVDNQTCHNKIFYGDIESNIHDDLYINKDYNDKSELKSNLNNSNRQIYFTNNDKIKETRNEVKEAGKPTDFCLVDTDNETNEVFVVKEHRKGIKTSNIYNMYPNIELKPSFNNISNDKYEFNYDDITVPILKTDEAKHDESKGNLHNNEYSKLQSESGKLDDRNQSISKEKTISTKAESKKKNIKIKNEIHDSPIEYVKKDAKNTDTESDNDNTDHDITEFKPKNKDIHDNFNKNKSIDYNKSNQCHALKSFPSKLQNSNLILNDLNKIDVKPKKPKLKKINKDNKRNNKEKESNNDKTQNKSIKVKQDSKVKVINQEVKPVNNNVQKPTTQILKAEPNASIKAISYWNDEPALFENNNKKSNLDYFNTSHLSRQDSDNNSISNSKKGGDKDKFKLKKKGNGNDKQSQMQKKRNSTSSTVHISEKKVIKKSNIPAEDKVSNLADVHTQSFTEELSEVQIKERIKNHYKKIMDSKIDQTINDLESHTHKLEAGRKIIQERISSIVYRTFNTDSVYVQEYGSYATRLLTPYSDMDLSIQGCLMLDREQSIEMLQVLCDNLKLFDFIKNATSILTALVPVIKIEADPSIEFENSETVSECLPIKVDIIVDLMDAFNPISTALRTTDYIKYCISNYPSFYKIILLLKFAMNCNDLNNTYKGGLNAYGLCILYVAYIEFTQQEKSSDHFELLRGFLMFLTTQFNPEAQAVYFGTAFR